MGRQAAYASGFEWDIFVSYSHSDDRAGAGDGKRWVREVVARLKSALSIHLGGDELKVFFDDNEFKGGKQLSDLLAAARSSAIFLAIASPAYTKREWTQQELAAFCESTGDLRRLFVIEYYPLPAGTAYPEPLQSHRREPFWRRDEPHVTVPVPMSTDDRSLFPTIVELADLIYKELERLKGDAPPPVPPTVAARDVVFLAQSTDDLEDDRDSVRRELEQYGYTVVPRSDYPQGGEEFKAAVEADLTASGNASDESRAPPLFVQLLGPRPGRRPADLPEGYQAAQFEIAQRLRCEMMLWRRPDLDFDAVSDDSHKALLGGETVIASGLSTFKAGIRERLEARKRRTAAASPPPLPSMVFINADRNDREAAGIVRRQFGKLDLPAFEPLYDGTPEEVHADLKGKIEDCEVLILLFGKAPLSWIHSQARLYQKLRAGARAHTVVVCVGPPPDAKPESPDDLGFTLPGLKWVETREEWKIEPMLELLSGNGKLLH